MESKAMTPEQLLARRYQCVIRYPHYPFDGDILMVDAKGELIHETEGYPQSIYKIMEADIKNNPCFKPLQWWERREPSEMPEYYKYSGNHGVFKTSFRINGDIVMLNFSPTETVPVNLAYCLPATKFEYDQYIKSKEK